jgi:uroporphyrinogen decarboxylase
MTLNGYPLSSRERVRLALLHQETDRIPIAMVCSDINRPVYSGLQDFLQRKRGLTVEAYLEPLIDIHTVAPRYIGPPLAQNEDIWSVRREPVSYGVGSYDEICYYPLGQVHNVADLEHHRWPNPDWFDYSVLPDRIAQIQAGGERSIMVENGNIFETSWYMRGFEQMFMDIVLNPELVHAIMTRVTDFYIAFFTRVLVAGQGEIDLVFTADDIAGQQGPFMSRAMWEEFIKPYHVRLNAAIHSFDGVKVIYHTDGAAASMVDGLIDMGIDVLQALQFSAEGMDPVDLKQRFGDRLCFEGGVSVQTTLPFGSVADVQDEVRHLIRTLGENGGYVLGPSHNIQAGTPPENIVALFDTAASYYPF